jgi:6-pyruvoyltetrahydropterin/6-carboxytetrahydropterin synthase
MDFGGLKEFKEWLEHMFDHTLLVAEDDPQLDKLMTLGTDAFGIIADIRVVPAVGCERFAELAFDRLSTILAEDLAAGTLLNPTVRVKSVEVFEHDANSAIVERN